MFLEGNSGFIKDEEKLNSGASIYHVFSLLYFYPHPTTLVKHSPPWKCYLCFLVIYTCWNRKRKAIKSSQCPLLYVSGTFESPRKWKGETFTIRFLKKLDLCVFLAHYAHPIGSESWRVSYLLHFTYSLFYSHFLALTIRSLIHLLSSCSTHLFGKQTNLQLWQILIHTWD